MPINFLFCSHSNFPSHTEVGTTNGTLLKWSLYCTLISSSQDVSKAPISKTDEVILTIISYLGCGLSAIFLGVTLITYLAFE